MKHKHYEMIVAKAENMDLVVFIKMLDNWEVFTKSATKLLSFSEDYDYFLCLPQHKEACLHWLDGGDVECKSKFTNGWESCGDIKSIAWCESIGLMRKDASYRVKPKKEKRWIGTCKNFVTSLNYPSIDECKDAVGDDASWQFHEIEVEV